MLEHFPKKFLFFRFWYHLLFFGGLTCLITACLRWGPAGLAQDPPVQNDITHPALQGIWQSEGYGRLIEIQENEAATYDVTQSTCVQTLDAVSLRLASDYVKIQLNSSQTQFTYQEFPSITVRTYTKIAELPLHCRPPYENSDPELNFQAFWEHFEEHYTFFQLRQVDWQKQYELFRPQVTSQTTDDELFKILSQMIKPFQDAHVSLETPEGEETYSFDLPEALPALANEFDSSLDSSKVIKNMIEEFEKMLSIVKRVYLHDDFEEAGNDLLLWGNLTPRIGYLNLIAMEAFSGEDDEIFDLAELKHAMETFQQDLHKWDALVIDVRFNGGGMDEVSLFIAGHFTAQSQLAFTKKARRGNSFTKPQVINLVPEGASPFTKPIVLLTSPITASAAEIFTLSMKSLPHVTLLGEPTIGALSDILDKQLPNGWELGLSNEVYQALDGTLYEKIGIPPDIESSVFLKEDRLSQKDSVLEKALSVLETKLNH